MPIEVRGVVPKAEWRLVNEWDGQGSGEEWEEEEEEEDEEEEEVGAVYPNTR